MPLEQCPGLEIWQKHSGREYLVFIDESFYKFFGFSDPDGDFCHGALGVPRENYAQLEALMRPEVEAFHQHVSRINSEPRRLEIKSTSLWRLPLEFRLRFTQKLVQSLVALGGFVAGFYSTTRWSVMEHLRTDLLGTTDRVPVDHVELYEHARTDLLAQFQGIAQSELIKRLLLMPLSAITNLLGSFDCTFRVRYDPRCRVEDEEVRRAIAQYMEQLINVPELYGPTNRFLGMEIDIPSHQDLGLQLVDVVVGDVRHFFRENREFLTENATLKLIDNQSDEPLQQLLEYNNTLHKIGALSQMSPGSARKLDRQNSENMVSYYYPVLASGILNCVTETGQPRLVEIPAGRFLDQSE
jgi:hypothetical protein